mmetsp:Transcript_43789/g.70085  ORF Transcript_43789/g.70085 Transcript_43789/m.70085 type:complete len:95 (-) Transcript_43789:647-931(-)
MLEPTAGDEPLASGCLGLSDGDALRECGCRPEPIEYLEGPGLGGERTLLALDGERTLPGESTTRDKEVDRDRTLTPASKRGDKGCGTEVGGATS